MKRFLPYMQLIVGLIMLPQAFLLGALGTFPLLSDILTGHAGPDLAGRDKLYGWSLLVASFSVDAAFVLCLVGSVLLFAKSFRYGVRLSITGVICYWIYIVDHLLMASALHLHLTLRYLTIWDVIDYPIGLIAALVAFALYSNYKASSVPASPVTS